MQMLRFLFSPLCIQKDKDKFGNDVTFLARPLPVEYLIIDVSACFFFFMQHLFLLILIDGPDFMCDVSTDNHHVSKGPPVHLLLHTTLPHREP